MTFYLRALTGNAILSALSTDLGASPLFRLYGEPNATAISPPNGTGAAVTGTLAVTMTLGATPFLAPSAGVMQKNGTWSGIAGAAVLKLRYWRLVKADGTTVVAQGEIGLTGALNVEATVDNLNVGTGQTVTATAFQLTAPNLSPT